MYNLKHEKQKVLTDFQKARNVKINFVLLIKFRKSITHLCQAAHDHRHI